VGLAPDELTIELEPHAKVVLPAVSVGFGATAGQAARGLAARALLGRPSGPQLLTEWNHWWPYEDQEINEDVFLANAELAAGLGLEVAVLDAGWFGGSAVDSDWTAERGDWHKVNTARFPSGLAWLAEQTRQRGIEFGIWIEAEAVGRGADLQTLHPEFLAVADRGAGPEQLGYVCLGSPVAAAFITDTVRQLIATTRARWIKWDFNLDPGLGCDRSDHGHRSGEGLFRHYQGLYAALDTLRSEFPDTVFEACSSGGLRIDLGLAEHVDCLFLSDPDWTEHHLAVLWGACQLLPPRQILHWVQSEWRGEHRFQHADYSGSLMTSAQFDLKVQSAMLHRFGISIRLPELRADLRDRLTHHIDVYKARIRPLLEEGLLWPLNEQPLREEKGNRRPAFQLSSGDDHLVAAFRLPPAWDWEPVRPEGLDPAATYAVSVLDVEGRELEAGGAALMADGIPLPEGASSTLVLLSRQV
jgi:alpha-galactosidase